MSCAAPCWQPTRARCWRSSDDAHAGTAFATATPAVTVIQRFGGGLNLNVHFHTLVLDGVFTDAEGEALRFRPLPPPTDEEVGSVLATIYLRVGRLLRRRGFDAGANDLARLDPVAEESPMLVGISSASIQRRIALGCCRAARGTRTSPASIPTRCRRAGRRPRAPGAALPIMLTSAEAASCGPGNYAELCGPTGTAS
jgi:hypothetical protein